MRLSDLKTGDRGVIVKVLGHGGFRKRIIEMGFIKGTTVEVLLNAPLQDPVKYKLLGYEVSLRHDEASMIEIISEEEAKEIARNNTENLQGINTIDDDSPLSESQLHDAAMKKLPLWAIPTAARRRCLTSSRVPMSVWAIIQV